MHSITILSQIEPLTQTHTHIAHKWHAMLIYVYTIVADRSIVFHSQAYSDTITCIITVNVICVARMKEE